MRAPCLSFRCPLRWEDLDGPGPTRHCARCEEEVHDLSALGPERATELLALALTERVCVRFLPSRTGQILFAATLAAGLSSSPAHAEDPYGTWADPVHPGEGGPALRPSEPMMGMLDRSLIQDPIQSAIPSIKEAWLASAALARGASGKVVTRLTIRGDGTVAEVEISQSELEDADFEAALMDILRELNFTTPGGQIVVSYPFRFEPEPSE